MLHGSSRGSRHFWCLVLFIIAAPPAILAQPIIISGIISDRSGDPLPGANVFITELTRGASTDVNGRYVIEGVPAGTYSVRFSYIGFKTQLLSVAAGAQPLVLDVQLQPDYLGLDELVVTAIGIARERREIGYATQSVGGAELEQSLETNIVNALAGKLAGIQVNNSSGQPGQSSRVTIRGNSSMLGNNEPLFVVDGVPISNAADALSGENVGESILFRGGGSNRGIDLDPGMIQDVTVLKGASATALYGSRAANGVILITTRGGLQQRGVMTPRVSFASSVTTEQAILGGYQDQYLQGIDGRFRNGLPASRGGYSESGGATQGTTSWGPHKDSVATKVLQDLGLDRIPTYDPRTAFYRDGTLLNNTVSLHGTTEQANYFLSLSNTNHGGIVPNTRLERTNVLANFGNRFGENLQVSTSLNYSNTANNWLAQGNSLRSYLFTLNATPISFDLTNPFYEDGTERIFADTRNNPFWLIENSALSSEVNRFIGNTSVTYEFLPWLSLTERLGIDTYVDTRKQAYNRGVKQRLNGSVLDQTVKRSEINSDLLAAVDRRITPDFRANVNVGNNINVRRYQHEFIQGLDLNLPGFYHISNASTVSAEAWESDTRLVSVFGQATLDYQDMLYLTLAGRNDWSSTLPKHNRSYFYPSASVGFVFTEALRLSEDLIPFGKLRLAVGQIGNDAPVYSLATTYNQGSFGDAVRGQINFPYNGVNGYALSDILGNPNLKPERTFEYEGGVDLLLLDGRAGVDLSYYNRSTRDQIYRVPVSAASGFSEMLANAGEIRNHGLEVVLKGTPVRARRASWDFQVTFSNNKTEVVELAEGVESLYLSGFSDPQIRIMPGKNGYGVIWSNRHQRNEEGKLQIGDDGYPLVDDELGPIGFVQPDWLAGIRNTFRLGGFSLSALVDIRQGGDVLNMDLYYNVFYGTAKITEQRNTPIVWDGVNVNTGQPNTKQVMQDQDYFIGPNAYVYSDIIENFVEDASFIKLRDLTVSYNLPARLVARTPFSAVDLSASGRNLLMKSNFSLGDPEGSLYGSGNGQGFYHNVTPGTRSYAFGIRITV